ncbi:hypothetical protein BJX61DRAFT_545391 [Aspergillus egyptiacus]|nr:hypothetical protein BJX61DRAFT_545391 [Aspergillus egyptiacus]
MVLKKWSSGWFSSNRLTKGQPHTRILFVSSSAGSLGFTRYCLVLGKEKILGHAQKTNTTTTVAHVGGEMSSRAFSIQNQDDDHHITHIEPWSFQGLVSSQPWCGSDANFAVHSGTDARSLNGYGWKWDDTTGGVRKEVVAGPEEIQPYYAPWFPPDDTLAPDQIWSNGVFPADLTFESVSPAGSRNVLLRDSYGPFPHSTTSDVQAQAPDVETSLSIQDSRVNHAATSAEPRDSRETCLLLPLSHLPYSESSASPQTIDTNPTPSFSETSTHPTLTWANSSPELHNALTPKSGSTSTPPADLEVKQRPSRRNLLPSHVDAPAPPSPLLCKFCGKAFEEKATLL